MVDVPCDAGCKAEEDDHRRRCTKAEEEDISQCSWQCDSEACQEKEDSGRTRMMREALLGMHLDCFLSHILNK